MTNRERMIIGIELLQEGCENISICNPTDCPLYPFCYRESIEEPEKILIPPCEWTIEKEKRKIKNESN